MITKRQGVKGVSWQVVVRGAPVNGKRPHLTGTFGTKSEAAEAEARFKLQLGMGAGRATGTTQQHIKAWQDGRKTAVAITTWSRHNDFVSLVCDRLGSIKLRDLTPKALEKFYTEILESGSRSGGALSARTVLHIHRMLHKFLEDMVRLEVLHTNAASKALPPRVVDKERDDIDPDVLSKVAEAMSNNRAKLPLLLMATTGLRRSEVCGLKWDDLSEDGVLSVQRARVRVEIDGKKVSVTKEPKRRKSIRGVTVPADLIQMLEEWRKNQIVELVLRGVKDEGWMFTNTSGQPIVPSTLTTAITHVSRSIGAKVSPQLLRHAHATLLLANDVPIKAVSERLGHSNTTVTMNVYARMTRGLRDAATDASSGILTQLIGKNSSAGNKLATN